MKKFIIQISHTEYTEVEIEAENEQVAEELALKNIDYANWGNDETDIIDIEEVGTNKN